MQVKNQDESLSILNSEGNYLIVREAQNEKKYFVQCNMINTGQYLHLLVELDIPELLKFYAGEMNIRELFLSSANSMYYTISTNNINILNIVERNSLLADNVFDNIMNGDVIYTNTSSGARKLFFADLTKRNIRNYYCL